MKYSRDNRKLINLFIVLDRKIATRATAKWAEQSVRPNEEEGDGKKIIANKLLRLLIARLTM